MACTIQHTSLGDFNKEKRVLNTVQLLLSALKECTKACNLERGRSLHMNAVECGCHTSKYIANALINMYCKCSSVHHARCVFESMLERDIISWNTLILGYVENGQSLTALNLFTYMDCEPDTFTFVSVIKACTGVCCLEKGMSIHRMCKALGYDTNVYVASALVDMYSKCRFMSYAQDVFDSVVYHNVVLWNTLILGYVDNGESSIALEFFASMDCEPDTFTFVAVIKGVSSEKHLEKGMFVHKLTKERGFDGHVYVGSNLVDMYINCSSICDAQEVFYKMAYRNAVAWNTLMLGYVENGDSTKALDLFKLMDCEPDRVTFVALLKACACLSSLATGKNIHVQILMSGMEQHLSVATMLVDFYGKCSNMSAAEHMFNALNSPDGVSFSTLMAGYSLTGNTHAVLKLVEEMQEADIHMDSVVYMLILTACSHAGMVNQGRRYFLYMLEDGIYPDIEHFNCVVDMFARANRLQEALSFVKYMPEVNHVTWTSVLRACNNVQSGKVAFDKLVACDNKETAAYVLMGDMYKKHLPAKERYEGMYCTD